MKQDSRDTFAAVTARIDQACRAAGRNPGSVRLLAVSKTHPPEAVRRLQQHGQRAFGESYVDEGVAKIEALAGLGLEWHYVGPIQSNKTRAIATHFDWVQSVDRLKIARRLDRQRSGDLESLQVLIQVNIDNEPQKAGCAPAETAALADEIAGCERLALRGLMAIPAPKETFAEQKQSVDRLRGLYEDIKTRHPDIDTLSAGMSADLEAAIAAGATMVRIGTALFGERKR